MSSMSGKMHKGKETYYPRDRQQWREWLASNYDRQEGVWLILYKKSIATSNLSKDMAIDEALCYGWIDSTPSKRDAVSYFLYFSPRNPDSNWSRSNKQRVEQLQQEGQMAEPGLKMIELAKVSGTWDALNEVEDLIVPPDLKLAFAQHDHAETHWEGFAKSTKRSILEWIFNAKRTDTRRKRVEETARLAGQNTPANQYKGKD